MDTPGSRISLRDTELSGFYTLTGAVISTGMGQTTRWLIKCVKRHYRGRNRGFCYKMVKYRKLRLLSPIFANPGWMKTDCGRWWASLVGLDPQYVYKQAGGEDWGEEECSKRSHIFWWLS